MQVVMHSLNLSIRSVALTGFFLAEEKLKKSLAKIKVLEDALNLGSGCRTKPSLQNKSFRTVSANQNWEPSRYGYDKKNTVQ